MGEHVVSADRLFERLIEEAVEDDITREAEEAWAHTHWPDDADAWRKGES